MRRTVGLSLCICFLLGLILSSPATAEIYQYRDKNGNLCFSDTPPPGQEQKARPMKGMIDSGTGLKDIYKKLMDKYHPRTGLEAATLATVTITTSIAKGSGFFITNNGYIITNRHVIKGDKALKKRSDRFIHFVDGKIKEVDQQFEAEENKLNAEKARLERMKSRIDEIENPAMKKQAQDQYEMEYTRYRAWKENYEARKARYESGKRQYSDRKFEYESKTAMADVDQSFTVTLKDGEKLYAYLVCVSDQHDLALLKVDGCRTPALTPADDETNDQGETVYAIGSPVTLRDSVSKGILSGYEKHFIKTDARIYPGNSGGPLVNKDGRVLGINTFKKLTYKFEGLGFAIPIQTALTDFDRELH